MSDKIKVTMQEGSSTDKDCLIYRELTEVYASGKVVHTKLPIPSESDLLLERTTGTIKGNPELPSKQFIYAKTLPTKRVFYQLAAAYLIKKQYFNSGVDVDSISKKTFRSWFDNAVREIALASGCTAHTIHKNLASGLVYTRYTHSTYEDYMTILVKFLKRVEEEGRECIVDTDLYKGLINSLNYTQQMSVGDRLQQILGADIGSVVFCFEGNNKIR